MKFKIKRILAVMLVFFMMLTILPMAPVTAHAASVADEIAFFTVNGQQVNNVTGSLDRGTWSWNGDSKRLYLKDYKGSDIKFTAKSADVAPMIDVYVSGECEVNGDFWAPYGYDMSTMEYKGGFVRFNLASGASLTITGELDCYNLEVMKTSSDSSKATFTVLGGVDCAYSERQLGGISDIYISGNIVATFGDGSNEYGVQGRSVNVSAPVILTVKGSKEALKDGVEVKVPTSGYDVNNTTNLVEAKPKVTSAVTDLLAVTSSPVTLKVGETKGLALRVNPDVATNKNVTWTSSDPSVAKVTQTNNIDTTGIQISSVTGLKAGTATITATADDGSGKTVSWTVTVQNSTAMPTISYDATNFTVTATGEGTVKLYKGDVEVTNPCVLTQTDSEQTYVFKATAQETGKEISATTTKSVTVPAKVTITLDKTEVNVTTGWPSFAITATVTPADKTVTWSSDNESVATVDENGIVEVHSAGTATITATAGDKSASCVVNVEPKTTITLDKTEVNVTTGWPLFAITATVTPADKTVIWSSDNESVATVDENGIVEVHSAGTATITATAGDKSASCVVNVTEATTITLDKTEVNVTTGWPEFIIAATVRPADKAVTWSSDNESVATVNENGVVKVHSAGKATITATVDGVSASCVVNVTPATTITLDKTEVNVTTGWPLFAITATVTPADKTVIWSSDNESVATVDENGIVEVHSAGKATITATAGDKSASCVVNVTPAVQPFVDLIVISDVIAPEAGTDASPNYVVDSARNYTVEKAEWWMNDSDSKATEFVAGTNYRAVFTVVPKEGVVFDSPLKVKINGNDATVISSSEDKAVVSISLTATGASVDPTFVDLIVISDVIAPEAGTDASIAPNYVVDSARNYTVEKAEWWMNDSDSKATEFVAGTNYRAVFTVVPKEGVVFDSPLKVKINGNDATVISSSEDKAVVSISLTATGAPVVPTEYDITVTGGTATPAKAAEGTLITLTANAAPAGQVFDKWEVVSGGVTITDNKFTMPANAVEIKATYKDKPSSGSSSGGGFSGSYNYPVIVGDTDGADVAVSDDYAVKGEKITITVKPEAGEQVDEVIVTDKDGKVIPVTKTGDNEYTFTMPASKVTVDVATEAADYGLRIVMQINNKNILVNGKTMVNDVAPVIVGDRTLVPIRVVTELLGGSAHWDNDTRTVTLKIDDKTMNMTIGKEIPGFGTSAVIMNSRTYVPVRYVMENLGAEVTWIDTTQKIIIEK